MNPPTATQTGNALSGDEARSYHRRGYLGPFRLCSRHRIQAFRDRAARLFDDDGPASAAPDGTVRQRNPHKQRGFGRHHDNRFLFDLATRREIVDRVTGILGSDLLLWRTMFFVKEPGEKRIPWHQDFDDWPIEPFLVTSAWIAIDDTDAHNGCLEVIPGSHRRFLPMVPAPEDTLGGFSRMADPAAFDADQRVQVPLQAGQFILFNERLLHQSGANTSSARRMALAVRFIPPLVRVLDDGDRPILLRGRDSLGFNRLAEPPDS